MKNRIKLIFIYWLPVVFVAAMIFTASSQPYEKQDIRPYLSQVTDLEKIKNMYQQLKIEHVSHRLYVEENGLKRTLTLVIEKGKWMVGAVVSIILIGLVIAIRMSIAYIKEKGYKRYAKTLAVLTTVCIIGILLVLMGVLFAFRVEDALLLLKDRLVGERTQQLVKGIEFSYAGNLVSVERSGLEGFIEFLMRKAAHFSFFFLLGFLSYRAMIASGWKKTKSYVCSAVFVLLYAISDEVHQAFTPNRSPLVEDVILDFAGGMTGITIGLVVFSIFHSIKLRKAKYLSNQERTTRFKG